jgi:hypothetical protein
MLGVLIINDERIGIRQRRFDDGPVAEPVFEESIFGISGGICG